GRMAPYPNSPLADELDTLEALPSGLTCTPNWVRRTRSKVPLKATGEVASVKDPATWSRFEDARRSNSGVGLGFVLDGTGIGCVDIDKCLSPEGIADWAMPIVTA